jgi:serine/threonine protein kinase
VVDSLVSNGKSAVVLRAIRAGQLGALKVFDPEIVERYGKSKQLERIRRELLLCENPHSNLAVLFDGGECLETGYLYLVMGFVEGAALDTVLDKVPRTAIASIVAQVSAAAQHLETLGLAHRDIKPANIMVSADFLHAKLMDLGVLKPIAASAITDDDGENFIGTHQYSPPEFLARDEDDTVEGWRAITFYQLGAVLHDLIMRRPLFGDEARLHGRLVSAIKDKIPQVFATDVPPSLVLLAQNCLQKEPSARLRLVAWEALLGAKPERDWDLTTVQERIKQRRAARESVAGTPMNIAHGLNVCREVRDRIQELARREATDASALPPAYVSSSIASPTRCQVKVDVPPSPSDALDLQLTFLIDVDVIDNSTMAVSVLGSACVAGAPPSPPETISLFNGSLADDILGQSLARFFVLGLDLAQAKSVGADETTRSDWLTLPTAWEVPNG